MNSPMRPAGRSVVGPVILILLGLAFLANNLGWVDWNIWNMLWRLWPVWLIAAGLDLIIGRRFQWGSLAVLAIVLVIGGGAVWFGQALAPSAQAGTPQAVNQPLDDIQRAEIVVSSSVGRLSIGRAADAALLAEGSITPMQGETVTQRLQRSGKTGRYTVESESQWFGWQPVTNRGGNATWDLRFTDQVPLALQLDTGVGENLVDLSGLQIEELDIDSGVGNLVLTLPEQGRFRTTIDGGMGNLTLHIPQSLAVRLQIDSGVGKVRIPSGLNSVGEDEYETQGYASASDRSEITIDAGVGNITIEFF